MTAPFSEARQVPPRAGRRAALPPALPVLIAALAAALVAARGAAADGRDGDLAALLEETGRAAKGILRDDRVLALHGLDVAAARASSLVAGAGPAADRRRAERLLARVGAARAVVADGATSPRAAWRRVRAVLAAAARARARLRRTDAPPPLDLRVPPATVLPAGGARTLRVEVQGRAAAVPGDATLVVVDEGPGVTLAGDPVALPGGGLRFRGGAGPGTALVIVSAGGREGWIAPSGG